MKITIFLLLTYCIIITAYSRSRRNVAIGIRSTPIGRHSVPGRFVRSDGTPANPQNALPGPGLSAPIGSQTIDKPAKPTLPTNQTVQPQNTGSAEVGDNGEEVDEEQAIGCLGTCMFEAILLAAESLDNGYAGTCKRYRKIQFCLNSCPAGWLLGGDEIVERCGLNSGVSWNHYQQCYEQFTDDAVAICLDSCEWNEADGSAEEEPRVADLCQNIQCVSRCVSRVLNAECDGAGDGLDKVLYSPFDSLRLNRDIRDLFRPALQYLPVQCRNLFFRNNRPQAPRVPFGRSMN